MGIVLEERIGLLIVVVVVLLVGFGGGFAGGMASEWLVLRSRGNSSTVAEVYDDDESLELDGGLDWVVVTWLSCGLSVSRRLVKWSKEEGGPSVLSDGIRLPGLFSKAPSVDI